MLDFIYTLLIAPLEYWMHAALVWGYSHTANWGWAIVVMSLAVNTVILPIYIKAEKWQEDERALRKSFEAKEQMIKRTFKGQERFAMITTLHRQAGYSPLLALRSSIGFFLQIPFFFAAYHFLSHFEPLEGISFLGLHNLSEPDAAISFGAVTLNVMPLIMTAINLASALIYTHNLTRRDKWQLYGMAAVFLVLLYDAASGLVLYWTCNNIYSFAKNVVYQELGRIQPLAARLWNALKNRRRRFPDEIFGKSPLALLPLLLWAAGAALALLSSNQVSMISEILKARLSFASDLLFLTSIAAALLLALKMRLYRHHLIIFLVSIAVAYYGFKVWGKWYFLGDNRRAFAVTGGVLFLIPALGVFNASWNLGHYLFAKAHSERSSKPAGTLLVPAGIWLSVLLAAYLPVQAYCTAPELFSSASIVLAKSLMWTALLGAAIWIFGFVATEAGAKNFAGYLLGAVATVLTIYAFLLPLNVGTIDAFLVARPEALFRDLNLVVDIAVVALALFLFALIVKKGGTRWLKSIFVLCTLGALINGTHLLWQTRGQWKGTVENTEQAKTENQLPDYNDRLFGFSRTGKNIVVVLLDSFTGTHVNEILKLAPELRNELSGFTWYVDNISSGGSTNTGIAALICGSACTPAALNAAGDAPLAEKINARYGALVERLGKDWDVSLYERNWLEPIRLERHTDHDVLAIRNLSETYVSRYITEHNIEIGRGDADNFLLAVSVFSSVPWSSKNLIYKNGRWFEQLLADRQSTLVMRALRDWSLMEQLPELSNTRATKANTFKFIDTELTHSPWFMDPDACRIVKNPKGGVNDAGQPLSHLATEICALKSLSKWFAWMRASGVWDNTTVVIAGDHSASDDPVFENRFKEIAADIPSRANALLLIKHGKSEAPLVVDTTTSMSPPAAASIWTGETVDTAVRHHFTGKPQGSHYLVDHQWEVHGPLWEPSAWRKIE